MLFFDKTRCRTEGSKKEFECELFRYCETVLSDWFLKLWDQYKRGMPVVETVPVEHREALIFLRSYVFLYLGFAHITFLINGVEN